MKTLFLSLICAAVLQITAMAQAVGGSTKQQPAPANKIQQKAVKPAVPAAKQAAPAQVAPKSANGPATKPAAKGSSPAKSTASPIIAAKPQKGSTPDRRLKENKKLKNDGKPETRIKENKKPAGKSK